jgi:hypothetical protein
MKQLVPSYFKPFILLFFLVTFATQLQAQVKIGENPERINPFSLLELESTDKAFLFLASVAVNAMPPSIVKRHR